MSVNNWPAEAATNEEHDSWQDIAEMEKNLRHKAEERKIKAENEVQKIKAQLRIEKNKSQDCKSKLELLSIKNKEQQEELTKANNAKEKALKMLKLKYEEIDSLQNNVDSLIIKKEQINQYVTAEKDKISAFAAKTYSLSAKLKESALIIEEKDKKIKKLELLHKQAMNKTQILIERFYRDKFFVEPPVVHNNSNNKEEKAVEIL